jgi:hypothetical protein
MTEVFDFGGTGVAVCDGYTRVVFPDGSEVTGRHDYQYGQEETAADIGFGDVEEMNRSHDLLHVALCHAIGLPVSPTLNAVSKKEVYRSWEREEATVLSLQAFIKAAGLDPIEVARRISRIK